MRKGLSRGLQVRLREYRHLPHEPEALWERTFLRGRLLGITQSRLIVADCERMYGDSTSTYKSAN